MGHWPNPTRLGSSRLAMRHQNECVCTSRRIDAIYIIKRNLSQILRSIAILYAINMSTLAFCTSPVLQCSLTPATRLKYSSKERDPFRLAGQLDGAARSGRACQMARSHGLLVQSAAFLQGRGQSTNAASCLIKAFYLSEGFVEVSPLYCTILQELLHSLLGVPCAQ